MKMPDLVRPGVLAWGSDIIEQNTIEQAAKTSRLPFVEGHLALMPDAHLGKGSTVGSVIPTKGAIIPAAVGVDIGCGMAAIQFDIKKDQLPDLAGLMPLIEKAVPAGVGQGHVGSRNINLRKTIGDSYLLHDLGNSNLESTATSQCGSLGSGNHFFELCVDEDDTVWMVLHSGSRGVGNKMGMYHIDKAKGLMKEYFVKLEDPDLAYFVQNTDEMKNYLRDMHWAQDYAALNRKIMLDNARTTFVAYVFDKTKTLASPVEEINCHHNFTQLENHMGKNLYITRKGAVKADVGDRGIIPGSMGAGTFIVTGLGNPASYNSSSHGAGRVFSRSAAKKNFTSDDLRKHMKGKVWNDDRADSLVDEIPDAYKDLTAVMEAQKDLVQIDHKLETIFNMKG